MPFIPHNETDIKEMLAKIGAKSIDELFSEIPANLRIKSLSGIPEGLTEMEIARVMQERATKDQAGLCFIGAGAYEHHIPAAVWDIVSRGEFYTAYTPYQAEASQGTLQLLYEFQTMIANLMAMDVANSSLYEGASALAEAVLMAVRAHKGKAKKILMPRTVHPHYRKTVQAIVAAQGIILEEIPYDNKTGNINLHALEKYQDQEITALVIPQPNFFGVLENVDELTNWTHKKNALVVGLVNPTAMALLKPPGQWGEKGADIACGEGQPLGVPLSSGGPYLGLIACKQELVRQMPGRIVGRTVDLEGKEAFALTLQAREQHIRRSKATSNICTSQSLLAIAATIYMSLLGAEGLQRVAAASHHNAVQLKQKLIEISGVAEIFHGPIFHEFVIRLTHSATQVLNQLAQHGIQGGFDLTYDYPELNNCLLICATETKNETDLNSYFKQLKNCLVKDKNEALI